MNTSKGMKLFVLILFVALLSACSKLIDNEKAKVVYISRRIENSEDWQLLSMSIDGQNQEVLSNFNLCCAPPAVSHDGLKVAFSIYDTLGYSLYTIGIDGSNLKRISSGVQFCGQPAWSADDSKIVFVKNINDYNNIYNVYVINADGSGETRLTNQNQNFSPQFSPDDNSIFYSSSVGNITGIYKMNPDGSNKQLLTPKNKSFGAPKISPDGNRLALTSIDWMGSQLFVMTMDSSSLKQITFTVEPNHWDSGFAVLGNSDPEWSPDGSKLVYVSYENGSPDVFVINADGTGNKRLTDTPLRDENPCWTNDGRTILFTSNRDQNLQAEIYIMKANGQGQKPITNYVGDDIYPQYSNN
jgi:TolB protein